MHLHTISLVYKKIEAAARSRSPSGIFIYTYMKIYEEKKIILEAHPQGLSNLEKNVCLFYFSFSLQDLLVPHL